MTRLKFSSLVYSFTENVRWIPEFEGMYIISDSGVVWSLRRSMTPRKLKAYLHSSGKDINYREVNLCKDKVQHKRKIAELVLTTFVGPRPKGMLACHYDDNKENNCLSNLRWDTYTGNNLDALRNRRDSSKLTEKDIIHIKKDLNKGWTTVGIAKKYGVSQPTISRINTGETWSHVVQSVA